MWEMFLIIQNFLREKTMLIDSEILIQKLEKESQETMTNEPDSKIVARKFLFLEDIVRIIKSCTGT